MSAKQEVPAEQPAPDEMPVPDEQLLLAAEVVTACGDAASAVARRGDEPDRDEMVRLIRAEVGRIAAGAATLVVAGEKKRGKSSLINALIGQPDLLPIETDVATSVHIVVRHAAELRADAYLEKDPEPQRIDPAKIAEYAALDPITQQARREDVRYVTVGVPSPLLARGLELVDTPGVGGLVSGHAKITMATLTRADALIFVVSGASELTQSELRFLEQATERMATVYFVLTQTDKYDAWQQVLVRNRALIREHALRYQDCPWFAVSSRAKLDADAAAAAGDETLAASLLADSGFTALTTAIGDGAARCGIVLRSRNALHVAWAAVDPLLESCERRLRSLSDDHELVAEVRAREAALGKLANQDAAWRTKLGTLMQELESRLTIGFRRSLNDVRGAADEKIATLGQDGLAEVAGDIEDSIRAAWMELENATRQGVGQITSELSGEFGAAGLADIAAELALPDRLRRLPQPIAQTDDGAGMRGHLERLVTSGGSGMVAFSVLSLLTGGVLMPVLIGLGVTVGLMGRRRRREELMRRRADASRYLQRVLNELQVEGPPAIREGTVRIGQQIAASINARLGQERARLEAEIAEYSMNLALAEQEREAQRAAAEADAGGLRRVAGRLADLQVKLASA